MLLFLGESSPRQYINEWNMVVFQENCLQNQVASWTWLVGQAVVCLPLF